MNSTKIFLFAILLVGCLAVVDRTYYIYLGLDISASPQDIKSAYEAKKQKVSALEDQQSRNNKLKILEQAYEILGNKEKRQTYDRLNKDLSKKSTVVSNFKKLTDKNSRKGKSIQITLPVSVQDVFAGKTVQGTFLRKTACDKCKGTGAQSPKSLTTCSRCGGNGFNIVEGVNPYGQKFVNENTCQLCQGWGKQVTKACPSCGGKKIISKIEKIRIKIPKGLPDGNIVRVPNFGDEPINGAPSDLEVTIVEIPTQKWSREGQNLIYTAQISLKQAIFGFSKSFIHLSGEQIPIQRSEVTTRDTTITIAEKGIQNIKTHRHGKLIVKFRIVMPKFSDKQLDMWQQFFKLHKL